MCDFTRLSVRWELISRIADIQGARKGDERNQRLSPKWPGVRTGRRGKQGKAIFPLGYTFKYTEGNNFSDRVPRIDISWRVGLQKAYCPFRLNLFSCFLVDRFTQIWPSCLNCCLTKLEKVFKILFTFFSSIFTQIFLDLL